jgi:hypothetical protein
MSSVYIRRVKRLNDEYLAARGALAYVARNWQAHTIFNASELEPIGPQDIKNAAEHLEETFIIRLFAEFEGMLKEYLAQHHPGIAVPEDARAVWLIDRVATLQSPHIVQPLRMRVHAVRRYRNALVHSGIMMPIPLQFGEARSSLNTYLDKLPEPLR